MPARLPEIEQRLREVWPDTPDVVLMLRIITTIEDALASYITVPLMVQLLDVQHGLPAATHAGDKERIQEVYRWISYLATEQIGLLDPHYELVRDDETVDDLDPRSVVRAIKSGVLHDPSTGHPVPDWERRVMPYYVATEALKVMRRESR